jgi:hypothetical protein
VPAAARVLGERFRGLGGDRRRQTLRRMARRHRASCALRPSSSPHGVRTIFEHYEYRCISGPGKSPVAIAGWARRSSISSNTPDALSLATRRTRATDGTFRHLESLRHHRSSGRMPICPRGHQISDHLGQI